MAFTVQNFTPYDPVSSPAGRVSPTEAVSFELLSPTFLRVLLAFDFEGFHTTELAYDGDEFLGAYASSSSVEAITGGYRYTLMRSPAWPDQPNLRIFAFDTAGGEL